MYKQATDHDEMNKPLPEAAGAFDVPDDNADTPPDGSLFDDVGALVGDGKTYLQAELQYQKARARYAGKHSASAAGFGIAAILCVFFALIGLTVGGVLLLIPRIGPIAATGLVVAVWMIFASVCGFIAGGHAARVSRVLKDRNP